MRLREGAPLEIFTEKDGELIFKKYSPIGELGKLPPTCATACAGRRMPAVCDRDSVIAVAGGVKELMGKSVSSEAGKDHGQARVLPPQRRASRSGL